MKTTNNVQKTENKKFKSSSVKTFAVVISLVVFSISASADGNLMSRFGSQENEQLLAYTTHSAVAHSSEVSNTFNAFVQEISAEKNLEIENWMTNEKYFGSQMAGFEVEMEESLKVEDWMLTNENFSGTITNSKGDSALEVEDWMLDASIWGS